MKTHSQGSGRTDGPPVGYAASVDDSRYGGLSSNKGGGGRGGGKGTKDGGNGGGDYSPTRVRASSSSQLGSPDVPPHLMPLENGGGARGRQQQGPSGSQTFTYGQNYNTSNASSSSSYVMPGDCNDTFLGGNSNGATLGFVDVRLTRPPDGMKPPERPSDSKIPSKKRKPVEAEEKADDEIAAEAMESRQRLNWLLRHFCDENRNNAIKTDIDLHKYSMDTGDIVTNATVQELCIVQPNIVRLDLSHCDQITDVALWAIARHCPNIQHLILSGCHQLTNIGLRSISLRCGELRTLDFTGCHLLDDLALSTIAGGCFKLEKLHLRYCTSITDTGVGKVVRACGRLKVLDLYMCTKVGQFGDHALKEIGAFCSQLNTLDITGCRHVHDPGICAIAAGCGANLEILRLSGCDGVTFKGLKALAKHCIHLKSLELIGCQLLGDKDMVVFDRNGAWAKSLTSISVAGTKKLTDAGVASIVENLGPNLLSLNVAGSDLTDNAVVSVTENCTKLRQLDISNCEGISNESVKRLANYITCLSQLKLDGNPSIAPRLLTTILLNKQMIFSELAHNWFGYQPKANVESLIKGVESGRVELAAVVKIQCMFRRKKAYTIWRGHRRFYLIDKVLPKLQAVYRMRKPYFRFIDYKKLLVKHRMALIIQTAYRRVLKQRRFEQMIQARLFTAYKLKCAIRLQKTFRGFVDRRTVRQMRNEKANAALRLAKVKAIEEHKATMIQCCWHMHVSRIYVHQLREARRLREERAALELRARKFIQRIVRGFLGKCRAIHRYEELMRQKYMFISAIKVQRVFRGMLGRQRAARERHLRWLRLINRCALRIQCAWRVSRAKVMVRLLRALQELRLQQRLCAVKLQRRWRGLLGRQYYAKKVAERAYNLKLRWASTNIQRLWRGHKGREVGEVERGLKSFEHRAKPLFDTIRTLEEESAQVGKKCSRLEMQVHHSETEIALIEDELNKALSSTSQLTDSSRINGIPQRFLTKYLIVRLQDQLENEKRSLKKRQSELLEQRTQFRALEREIRGAKRELYPLTTGLVKEIKSTRVSRLRELVRKRAESCIRIQALWRRALVRVEYMNPMRDYWIECLDPDQGPEPYYYNTYTQETSWKMPRAVKYFHAWKNGQV